MQQNATVNVGCAVIFYHMMIWHDSYVRRDSFMSIPCLTCDRTRGHTLGIVQSRIRNVTPLRPPRLSPRSYEMYVRYDSSICVT